MKKLLAIILTAAMAFALCACQTDEPAPEPVNSEAPVSEAPVSEAPVAENPSTPAEAVKLTIGAASVGGGFHNGASALANAINSRLDGYELAVEVTGASSANAALLGAGEVPLAMVDTAIAYEALHGVDSFEGTPIPTIRCLFPGWPGTWIFVTLASSGYADVTDLAGSNFSGATAGSGTQIFVTRLFELLGIEYTELGLPNSDGARGLGDGTVDGFCLMYPSSAVSELEASHELNILTLTEEQKTKFFEAYPQYLWLTVPAGSYKCVPETIYNPGAFNLFCTSSEVDEETVYQVVKCAYENLDAIEAVFPLCAQSMTPENLAMNTIPYHAGAIRYFEEQGWTVPENLIPEEAK